MLPSDFGEVLISYETYALINDQIRREEKGSIQIKGPAYPVASYGTIGSHKGLGQHRRRIWEQRPNVKLDLALDAMTPDERAEAVEVLRKALQMLDGCEKAPEDSISGRE